MHNVFASLAVKSVQSIRRFRGLLVSKFKATLAAVGVLRNIKMSLKDDSDKNFPPRAALTIHIFPAPAEHTHRHRPVT
jgi:hypothetical protein